MPEFVGQISGLRNPELALVMIIDILVPWRAALDGADTTPDHDPVLRAEGAASHG